MLAPATLAALPSTRTIPDRTCSMSLIPFVPFSCDDVGMFNANFSFSAFQIFSISNRRVWLDCCGLCPPVIKQIVFWILFLGLGCLFLLQKLHERKQHLAKASLATAASHSSPPPSASPVCPAAGQPAKPTTILPPSPALKTKPTPMLPKPTPMLPKPTPMLRPNPNGVQ